MIERRILALIIAATPFIALRMQFDVPAADPALAAPSAKLWRMAGYLTVLANLALGVQMAWVALNHSISGPRAAGFAIVMAVVGITYHLLLAGLWNPQGMAFWADQGLHTATPLLMGLWWLAFAPKDIGLRNIPQWLAVPVLYGAYALVRGSMTGFWPYPFLDVGILGPVQVAVNLAVSLAGFAVLGAVLVGLARLLR